MSVTNVYCNVQSVRKESIMFVTSATSNSVDVCGEGWFSGFCVRTLCVWSIGVGYQRECK